MFYQYAPRKHEVHQNLLPTKLAIILAYDITNFVCHPVPQGKTVNAQYYKSFLQFQLRCLLRKKRPELFENSVILSDNATAVQKTLLSTWSDSKVMRLIFSWLYWQYCSPPTRTDFDLGPSSILTCSGMAVQCLSVEEVLYMSGAVCGPRLENGSTEHCAALCHLFYCVC